MTPFWRRQISAFLRSHIARLTSTSCSTSANSSKIVWNPKRFSETSHRSFISTEDQDQKSCRDRSGLRADCGRSINRLMTLPSSFPVSLFPMKHFLHCANCSAILLRLLINWSMFNSKSCVTINAID